MNVTTARPMELGIYSFGELTDNPRAGQARDAHERIGQLLDHARIADQGGLDIFALGEHHRHDFAVSAPEVVLGAIATATSRIRLASGVTVLSSQDPVRVFQQFATLDQVSDGRAEIWAGRGAFTESFPLFGYQLNDYDELFEEKLELLLRLDEHERVTWAGRHRPPLTDAGIYPRPVQERLPVWVAVGGTPASVVRASRHGLPLYLAILGTPARFTPLAELYRSAAAQYRFEQGTRIGVTSHFYVEPTSQGARETFYPYYARYIGDNMPSARGRALPREAFEEWAGPRGALFAGSPAEVVDKILWEHELLGHDRFLAQIGLGGLPFAATARSIELLATEVLPTVRAALG